MDNTIERTEYVTEEQVRWGRCDFTIKRIFRDGPEEREKQKRALETLRDAPIKRKV